MWRAGWILVMAAVLAVASGCVNVGAPPTGVGTPSPGPAATTQSAASQRDDAAALLARAAQSLDQAKSYRFTVQGVHHWRSPEGQEYDWAFDGEGAAVAPGRFYSVMRGPADALFEMKKLDNKVTNKDARGQRPEGSTAFGGPGAGAAPYTIIAYLRNGAAQGQAQSASLNGAETLRVTFTPDLSKVAAVDASHKTLPDRVRAVQGSIWVDAKTSRVSQEAVTVQSVDSQGLPQTATITLKFHDYDAAVEIN